MNTLLHKAASRGHASHGWLDSWHSFSFAQYHDPARVHFGVLRVLNDDTVAPGMGFGRHPHDNMEIISIPLQGALEHQDNTGTNQVIRQGDVQAMSAGTGILHSEKNASATEPVKFLQIWIFPDKRNVQPRYDQKTFSDSDKHNKLVTVVSPVGSNAGGVEIHQDAWFSLGKLDAGTRLSYDLHNTSNGVYAFILEGEAAVNGQELGRRDGLGISDGGQLSIEARGPVEILVMEVPMN